MEYIAKLPNWLRWALLPVTFLIVSTLSSALFYFFMFIAPVGYMPENLIAHILAPLIGGFYGIVAIGYISPVKGKIVPTVFLALAVLLAVLAYFKLGHHEMWYWISFASQITGLIIGIFNSKNTS